MTMQSKNISAFTDGQKTAQVSHVFKVSVESGIGKTTVKIDPAHIAVNKSAASRRNRTATAINPSPWADVVGTASESRFFENVRTRQTTYPAKYRKKSTASPINASARYGTGVKNGPVAVSIPRSSSRKRPRSARKHDRSNNLFRKVFRAQMATRVQVSAERAPFSGVR